MMTIKIILLLGLAAYAACGGGNNPDDEDDFIDNYEEGNFGEYGNPNITYVRDVDGFRIIGRLVEGVVPFGKIEIVCSQRGDIIVNGEVKTGFEDIKCFPFTTTLPQKPMRIPKYTAGNLQPSETLTTLLTSPTLPTLPTRPIRTTRPTRPTRPTLPTRPTRPTMPTLPTTPTLPSTPTLPTIPPTMQNIAYQGFSDMYGNLRTQSSASSNLDGNHVDGIGSSQGTTVGNLQSSETLPSLPFQDFASQVLGNMFNNLHTDCSGSSNLDGNHIDDTGSSQGTTADTKEETELITPFVFDKTQFGIPAHAEHYEIVGCNLGNTNCNNNNINNQNWRRNNIGERSIDIDGTSSSQDQLIARYVINGSNIGNTNCNNNNINNERYNYNVS